MTTIKRLFGKTLGLAISCGLMFLGLVLMATPIVNLTGASAAAVLTGGLILLAIGFILTLVWGQVWDRESGARH